MGDVLAYSGAMRRLAVEVGKIASDLRLLSMGPRAGLSEIALPAVQPGSSIMPGKVNPSVPEMVNQVCFQVMGCDATVAIACEAGQLELNVMMPVIAWNALHASTILREAMKVLRPRCVDGIAADEARARELLDRSTAAATALSPYIGYAATAEIAKESVKSGRPIRELVLERGLLDASAARRDPVGRAMTRGGIVGAGEAGERRAGGQAGRADGRTGGARSEVAIDRSRSRSRLALPALPALPAPPRPSCPPDQQPKTPRCFAPQDLGLLEAPDREQWQKPDQIMDALGIAEGSVVAELGAGGGWFTLRLARRVGPNGLRLRRRHPAADDRRDQPPHAERESAQRDDRCSARRAIRSCRGGLDAVLISTRSTRWTIRGSDRWSSRCCATSARSLKPQGRARHRRLDAGRRRARARARSARRSRAGDQGGARRPGCS